MRAANMKPPSGGRGHIARYVPGVDWLFACIEPANRGGIGRVRV